MNLSDNFRNEYPLPFDHRVSAAIGQCNPTILRTYQTGLVTRVMRDSVHFVIRAMTMEIAEANFASKFQEVP